MHGNFHSEGPKHLISPSLYKVIKDVLHFIDLSFCCKKKKKSLIHGQHAALAGIEQTILYFDPSAEDKNSAIINYDQIFSKNQI